MIANQAKKKTMTEIAEALDTLCDQTGERARESIHNKDPLNAIMGKR